MITFSLLWKENTKIPQIVYFVIQRRQKSEEIWYLHVNFKCTLRGCSEQVNKFIIPNNFWESFLV